MTPELIRDAERPDGWWLLVGGSEQSFVDTADPLHLEFEYVQMVAHVVEALFATADPVDALHLGGGLCTIPRWVAARHPGSRQRVVEHSREIAGLARRLGLPAGVRLRVADAATVLSRARGGRLDLVVCDVYDGPETVTSLFTAGLLATARRLLRADGVYVCNLSDAAPFTLSRVVGASLRERFGDVVMLAEPAVLRGRRSGNVVFGATDREVPLADLTRRAASGPVRARVVAGEDLDRFVGDAVPAATEADVPRSGESGNRKLA
jgi:spermidine synthase